MTNETRSMWITYNGEIFNHASVRPDLEQAGHQYVSRRDTETILHAFEEYGPKCLHRFRGMFAFAIWDTNTRTLFCARATGLASNPFTITGMAIFVFGSEIKAILKHPAVPRNSRIRCCPEYLAFGYISEERTLFRGIRKLMPGHHLTLDPRPRPPQPRIRQYWDIPDPQPESRSDECGSRMPRAAGGDGPHAPDERRAARHVPLRRRRFQRHRRHHEAQCRGPVKTFAVGYSEAEYSELSYARQVAQAIGTDHHEVVVGMDDFFNALPR